MSSFDDKNFNIVDWINNNIDVKNAKSINEYEEQTNQLLFKIQNNGRNISKITELNMKSLVENLPQSIEKLRNVSNNIDQISESLRNLTNSTYKFKSSNIANKMDELSILRIKKDSLKEATSFIRDGLMLSKHIEDMKHITRESDLNNICQQYRKVVEISKSLSSIPKFHNVAQQLVSIRTQIENKVRDELKNALEDRNRKVFQTNAEYVKLIGSEGLLIKIVEESFKENIDRIITQYLNNGLPLEKWLMACYNNCITQINQFTDWCLSHQPSLYSPSIRENLLIITTDCINPHITSYNDDLLSRNEFDTIINIDNALKSIWKQFEVHKFSSSCEEAMFLSIAKIKKSFNDQLFKFFNSKIAQHMPKSSTLDTLHDKTTKSHVKSTSVDELTVTNTENFDKKLSEYIDIGKDALNWSRKMSDDINKSITLIVKFLVNCINAAHKEFFAKNSNSESLSALEEINKIISLIKYFMYIDKQSKVTEGLESDIRSNFEHEANNISDALYKMKEDISNLIVSTMSHPLNQILYDIHSLDNWCEEEDILDDELENEELNQSRYISNLVTRFLKIIEDITKDESIDHDMSSFWIQKAVGNILQTYTSEILSISKFTTKGEQQLLVDINYLKNMLSAFGFDLNPELSCITEILSLTPDKQLNYIESEVIPPKIYNFAKDKILMK